MTERQANDTSTSLQSVLSPAVSGSGNLPLNFSSSSQLIGSVTPHTPYLDGRTVEPLPQQPAPNLFPQAKPGLPQGRFGVPGVSPVFFRYPVPVRGTQPSPLFGTIVSPRYQCSPHDHSKGSYVKNILVVSRDQTDIGLMEEKFAPHGNLFKLFIAASVDEAKTISADNHICSVFVDEDVINGDTSNVIGLVGEMKKPAYILSSETYVDSEDNFYGKFDKGYYGNTFFTSLKEQMQASIEKTQDDLLLQNLPSRLLTVDRDGVIVSVNDDENASVIGKNIAALAGNEFDSKSLLYAVQQAYDTGKTTVNETTEAPGRTKYYRTTVKPIFIGEDGIDELGSTSPIISGVMINIVDISEQKTEEIKRKKAVDKEAAETATTASVMSAGAHDIRGMLGIISNALEHIVKAETGNMTEEGSDLCRQAHTTGDYLVQALSNLLDYNCIKRSGGISVVRNDFSFSSSIVPIVEPTLKSMAARKAIEFSMTVDPRLLENLSMFVGDVTMLNRVLNNLGSNAIKYSNAGSKVEMKIEILPSSHESGDDVDIRFSVKDNGIGLTKEQQSQLFQPNKRIQSDDLEVAETGTGLGLYTAFNMVKDMGGKDGIKVESEGARKGSTFSFELKLPISSTSKKTAVASTSEVVPEMPYEYRKYLKVLYVEDKDMLMKMGVRMLTSQGFEVITAVDGEDAVAKFKDPNNNIWCVFMDVQMPELDGLGATKQIRAYEASKGLPQTMIRGLSGNTEAKDRTDALESGMNDFLGKPVKALQLKKILEDQIKADMSADSKFYERYIPKDVL
jgi:signal transduction histidine kinase/ActR/RegA family two-component response regulator